MLTWLVNLAKAPYREYVWQCSAYENGHEIRSTDQVLTFCSMAQSPESTTICERWRILLSTNRFEHTSLALVVVSCPNACKRKKKNEKHEI